MSKSNLNSSEKKNKSYRLSEPCVKRLELMCEKSGLTIAFAIESMTREHFDTVIKKRWKITNDDLKRYDLPIDPETE